MIEKNILGPEGECPEEPKARDLNPPKIKRYQDEGEYFVDDEGQEDGPQARDIDPPKEEPPTRE